jgi:hypothetical protein
MTVTPTLLGSRTNYPAYFKNQDTQLLYKNAKRFLLLENNIIYNWLKTECSGKYSYLRWTKSELLDLHKSSNVGAIQGRLDMGET